MAIGEHKVATLRSLFYKPTWIIYLLKYMLCQGTFTQYRYDNDNNNRFINHKCNIELL